ncbi:MAG TPA: class I SAM-dependent methyltransferase [Nitriliruptorales bacterium]
MVRWLAKSAIQNAISRLPDPERTNHFFQRRVSRRIPISDQHLLKKVEWAVDHLRAARAHLDRAPSAIRAFEFGAGWDLVAPLTYWMAGIDRQLLIDIAPHVRLELTNHSIARLAELGPQVAERLGRPVRAVDPAPLTSLAGLSQRLGIEYRAPVAAHATGLPAGSFDLVTTSDTLEHVPAEALPAILAECRRLLADGGVMTHLIDMMDHYRYVDDSITVYNFLKYSDRAWRRLNSPIEPQNRLRLPDYRELFRMSGLEIVDEDVRAAGEADLAWLRRADIAPRFREYSIDDLGARSVRLTAIPASTS